LEGTCLSKIFSDSMRRIDLSGGRWKIGGSTWMLLQLWRQEIVWVSTNTVKGRNIFII
jgi:hypothetical protein